MISKPTETSVIIAGGGVAGLILAQGLRQLGIPFHVLERSARDQPQGYRFRLLDEGVEALSHTLPDDTWSILESSRPPSHKGRDLYVNAQTGRDIERRNYIHSNIYSLDRAWLHQLLRLNIEESISFDRGFVSYTSLSTGILVHCSDGTSIKGDLLVGADGNFSAVRHQLIPSYPLMDLKRTLLWGRTPMTEELIKQFSQGRGTEFLKEAVVIARDEVIKPSGSCLFAPIRWPLGGSLSKISPILLDRSDYMFSVLSFETPRDTSVLATHEQRKSYALRKTQGWIPEIRAIFSGQNDSLCVPVVSGSPSGPTWVTQSSVTLVGDAAHPSNGGRGGTTAVIDAAALAKALGKSWKQDRFEDIEKHLQKYECEMIERGKVAMEASMTTLRNSWGGTGDWQDYGEWIH